MDKINDTISATLQMLEVPSTLVEPKILKYFKKIETALISIFNNQEKIHNELKVNKPSISKISVDANISRQTLYNNPLLKRYIETRIDEYKTNDIGERNEHLQNKIRELTDVIRKMKARDINIELFKHKISLLEEDLKLKKKENFELRKRYNNVLKKKNELHKATQNNDIINFPR